MKRVEEGDKAPDFKGKDQHGKVVSPKDFLGKKLILFFYPKDDTPTCTVEACNLRDNYPELKKAGFEILGISVDDEKSHVKFIEKFSLPFPLIADVDKKIVTAYGVWGEKSMFGNKYMGIHRVTYVLDEKGKVLKRFDKVQSKDHAKQILRAVK